MKCIAHLLCGRVPGGRGQRPLGLVFGCGGVVVGLHNQDSFSGLSCPLEPFAKWRESPVPRGAQGKRGWSIGACQTGRPAGCRADARITGGREAREDMPEHSPAGATRCRAGIHPARSNPPPVKGLGSLRLRRVKPENDWLADNGFPTTAQRQASSPLCLSPHLNAALILDVEEEEGA